MTQPREHLAVPLIDLDALHRPLRGQVLERLAQVYDSGRFILGAEVRSFEQRVGEALGSAHAIGVSNGTDALVCSLLALEIGHGDTLITTPLSFIATATACLRTGANLRFVDVDPVDYNLSADQLASADQHDVRGIVAVHLFGQPADVPALGACLPGCPVVEDAAQAFGARWAGRNVGTLGSFGAFSFFPGKPLGALGDAGLVTTQDPILAERVRALRTHGRISDGSVMWLGGNYRLDELQAAVLQIKLEHDERRRLQRTAHAQHYGAALSRIGEVRPPQTKASAEPAWSVFALRVLERRDALREYLSGRGIETAVYYPRPLHLEPVLAGQGFARGDFPVAEACCEQFLALPVHAELRPEQLAHVTGSIAQFFGHPRPE